MKTKLSKITPTCISFSKSSSTYFAFCESLSYLDDAVNIIVRYEHFDHSIYVTSDPRTIYKIYSKMQYFI
jgi:hypothetical protein